jgi:hypothetical protein
MTICVVCKFKEAKYNYEGLKSQYCITCNFNYVNQKYKPQCFTCYSFENSHLEVVRNYKTKENTIMKFVKEKYNNCVLDTIISGGCSRRRPDGLIEFELFSVIIEIDEDAHRNYEDICENRRIMEIYQDLNFKPLRVIRFNPDIYKDAVGKKVNSIFSMDSETKKIKVKTKKELNKRIIILLETIEKIINDLNHNIENDIHSLKSVDIEYLFFNENE